MHDHRPRVPDAVRHSSCRSAEPGPYHAPVFVTAPAQQRTATQVLRAALRPGHERPLAAIQRGCHPSGQVFFSEKIERDVLKFRAWSFALRGNHQKIAAPGQGDADGRML